MLTNRISFALFTALLLTLFFTQFTPASQQQTGSPRQIWEYKAINAFRLPEKGDIDENLTKLGMEGWELVGIEPGAVSPSSLAAHEKDASKPVYYAHAPTYYFKRQVIGKVH